MPNHKCGRFLIIGALVFIVAALAPDRADAQGDLKGLETEIGQAWKGRDFPRVVAAGHKYLAVVADPDSFEQMVTFLYISGAETVAGRTDDAAGHLDRVVDYIVRATCQTQAPQHEALTTLLAILLQDMPASSRGNMQVMLVKVWDDVSAKGRASDPYAGTYHGFSTLIAAGLAQLYFLSGAESQAKSFAGEAVVSAPPVEVTEIPYGGENVCGCIRTLNSPYFLSRSSELEVDDYVAYIRGRIHRFTHPPRAMALGTALEIFMKTKDTERLRRAAFALEELRDRSLTTGSLNGWPSLNERVESLYKQLKERYADLWPPPRVTTAISRDEADRDPRLGRSGPPYTRKHVNRYGGESGKKYSFDYWPILLKTTLPVQAGKIPADKPWIKYAEESGRPANATTASVPGRAVAGSPWWLYTLEEGRLRVVGRAKTWNAGQRPDDPWELRVERLALGNLWSVDATLHKEESREPLELLGPVYVSQELLGPDFEDLPPHRQKLFLQGLPWVGMSARLMRVNIAACDKAIRNWSEFPDDFRQFHVFDCASLTVTVSGGRVIEVAGHPR